MRYFDRLLWRLGLVRRSTYREVFRMLERCVRKEDLMKRLRAWN